MSSSTASWSPGPGGCPTSTTSFSLSLDGTVAGPLTFVAFDLLAFADEAIVDEPYEVRRQLLDRLVVLSNGCLIAVPR